MSSIPRWLDAWSSGRLQLPGRQIGALVASSGAIIACDPLTTLDHARPYLRTVAPGTYEVTLGFYETDVAFAMVKLATTPVVRWEVARCSTDDTRSLPGFGVDAGMACFVDAAVAARYRETAAAQSAAIAASISTPASDAEAWHAEYARARDAMPDPLRVLTARAQHGVHVLELDGGNLIAFTSGAGDGVYPAFWALDAEGTPAMLLVDFRMFDDEDDSDEDLGEVSSDDRGVRRATQIVAEWLRSELVVLRPKANRDRLVTALDAMLQDFGEGSEAELGEAISEWLMDRGEIAEVFGTDAELAACIKQTPG